MKKIKNQAVWLTIIALLLVQTLPVAAAGNYNDPNNSSSNASQLFTQNSQQSAGTAADSIGNYYLNSYKNSWGWDWLKTTDISFSAFSGNTPQWNIRTFQPLTLKNELDNFLFAQGQYGTGNNTINLGLGYRAMNNAHTSLYGVNAFYDLQTSVQGENGYNASGSLMRVGAGLEYFTGSIETRLNGYYGVSSDVQVGALQTSGAEAGTTAWQHVAPGLDFSVGTDFSFWNAPWFKLTATGSWYQQTQSGTINGYDGSPLYANITAALQLTPQLSVNGGGSFGNGAPSNGNIGFQFNLLAPPQPAVFMADPVINKIADVDISYKMLQPVQRNNTVTVERYTKQEADAGTTVTVTVQNSDGGLVSGATVTLAAPPAASTTAASEAIAPATTNSSGVAVFQNVPLSETPYTLTIIRDGYTDYSTSVTVNSANPKPQVSDFSPAVKYTAAITVQDSNGNNLSGATVTLGGVVSATTNDNGVATLSVGAGNYPVSISKSGYSFTATTLNVNSDVSQTYKMTIVNNVSLYVYDGSSSGSGAVSGATVQLGSYAAVTTDSDGIAVVSNVADGTYTVNISASGYQQKTALVTVADGVSSPPSFGLTVVSKPNVYVTVAGLNAGSNIASFTVNQWSGSSVIWSQTYTNQGNGVTTVQLPTSYTGTYSVTAETVDGYTYIITNPTFTIDSTSQFVTITYAAKSGGTVKGYVLDSMDNQGVGGIIVKLRQDSVVINETTTAADGSYSFTGVSAGYHAVALLNASEKYVTVKSGETVTAANLYVLKPRVAITASGLAAGASGTVTITDIDGQSQQISVKNGVNSTTVLTYGEGYYTVAATSSAGSATTVDPAEFSLGYFASGAKAISVVFAG